MFVFMSDEQVTHDKQNTYMFKDDRQRFFYRK